MLFLLAAAALVGPPEPQGLTPRPLPHRKTVAFESVSTDWGGLIRDNAALFTLAASVRVISSPRTRTALSEGPFLRDWCRSATNIRGWNDGDKFLTNYVSHPLLGAVAADMYANRQSRPVRFGMTRTYWNAKLRQFAFAVVVSENFEVGVLSEAMIDNVGIEDGQATWQDHVYTPVFGIAFSIAEDAINAKVVLPMLSKNRTMGRILAVILTPIRAFANLLAFRAPWWRHPDGR